jgi:hypothetical protein
LTITPGAAGPNEFLLEIEGASVPANAEGVLRFTPPNRDLGMQELILPMVEPNTFHAAGSDLALPGTWQVQTIVRAIGAFSWATEFMLPVGQTPPPAPEPNPAPLFAPPAVAGMLAMTAGAIALAVVLAGSGDRTRRTVVAALGVGALAVGTVVVSGARLPAPEPILAAVQPATVTAPVPSPNSGEHEMNHEEMGHGHASPVAASATPPPLPGPGTPVEADGFTVEVAADPASAGPVDITVTLLTDDGSPLEGARVVVLSDMPAMAMGRTETPATETSPGQYVAASVPLVMPGHWHLAIRVSPRAESTQVVEFAVTVQ